MCRSRGRFACRGTFSKAQDTRRTAPHSGDRCEDLNCCLLSYLPLSAVLQCGEKNTLIKSEIPIPVKTGSYIRAAWQPQRSLLVHDVHECLSDHSFSREIFHGQVEFSLVVKSRETLIHIKPFLIGRLDRPDCNRDFRPNLWFDGEVGTCLTALEKQSVVLNHRSPHSFCRRTPQRHLPNVQVAAVG